MSSEEPRIRRSASVRGRLRDGSTSSVEPARSLPLDGHPAHGEPPHHHGAGAYRCGGWYTMSSMTLPRFVRSYLWDVPAERVHPKRHARFIAERVMEYGDRRASQWLCKMYASPTLRRIIRESHRLSPKSRHYWALMLNDRSHAALCTKKRSTQKRRHAWPR